jgi:uncharacterized protein YciI
MQFLITAYDGTDPEAPVRRQRTREAHLTGIRKLNEQGQVVVGGAILNDKGEMVGSSIIVDFPDRAALDAWLDQDPYKVEKVWQKIEIKPYRVAITGKPKAA